MTELANPFPGDVLEVLGDMPNYNNWIMEHFASRLSGRGAEVGAGLGTISELLRPYLDSLDLIEPTPALASQLRIKFAQDERCFIAEQTLEDWMEKTSAQTYDTIVLVNVLEHIEDDRRAAHGLYRALKPHGTLLIFVPALPFLYSELDRIYGHFRRYRRKELRDCIESAGFRIEKLCYFDSAGMFPWWLLNTVMGKTSFNQSLLSVYDKLFVPPTKFVESLLSPPFGKNLILVASKS